MIYGYARVSTTDQDLSVQLEALKNYGCENIRQEKVSGTSMQGRDELKVLLDFMRDGDELVVTRVDRLARSVFDVDRNAGLICENHIAFTFVILRPFFAIIFFQPIHQST